MHATTGDLARTYLGMRDFETFVKAHLLGTKGNHWRLGKNTLGNEMQPREIWQKLTWELMCVIFNIFKNVVICINDDESMSKYIDDSSNIQVLRTVERWFLGCTARSRYANFVQILATREARVGDRWLIDRYHVISQVITDNETTTPLFFLR